MSSNLNKIIIGSAQFGLKYGIANKNKYLNFDEINQILSYAYSKGINSIDTAKNYGDSEDKIGKYLSNNLNQKWKIITKVNDNKSKLTDQLKLSQRKICIFPNILMSHNVDLFISDFYQKELVLCKSFFPSLRYGVSVYNQEEIERAIKCNTIPEVIQLPINVLDKRLFESNIINECKNLGVEIHARSIFLQGLFFLSDNQIKKKFNDAFIVIQKLKKIGKKLDLTLPELSLLWVNSLNFIDKIVIGVDSLTQLKINIDSLENKKLNNLADEILDISYLNENILNPQRW